MPYLLFHISPGLSCITPFPAFLQHYLLFNSLSYPIFPILVGEFMPNTLTVDINANERLDIMRCKMDRGEEGYMNLARSNQEITVEIFREKVFLIMFTVPWKSRVQSRFLSHPRDRQDDDSMGTSSSPWASKFDPWMGFNRSTPGVWEREKLFMCVPGLESPPSRKVCSIYCNNVLIQSNVMFTVDIVSL